MSSLMNLSHSPASSGFDSNSNSNPASDSDPRRPFPELPTLRQIGVA